MSGGKETPRQKMIGMMYLVLTALLALNVSSAVLEKFAILNTTLVDLIGENTITNERKANAIAGSTSQDAKVVKAVAAAKEIRALSRKTIATLDSIKDILGREHDGKPMVGDELVGNTNISEEKMLNEESKLAPNYERTLVDFHDKLEGLSGMKFPKLNKRAVDFAELKTRKVKLNTVKNHSLNSHSKEHLRWQRLPVLLRWKRKFWNSKHLHLIHWLL